MGWWVRLMVKSVRELVVEFERRPRVKVQKRKDGVVVDERRCEED